jgi:beta-aspartyl-peptidase (threonine type)
LIPALVTHGGAGAPASLSDGPQRAAELGLRVLIETGSALEAAIRATMDLEDDPRFNAGTGSNLRLDGRTIEMDASVMTSDGRSGAVANLPGVKNPVRVAADVRARTPHVLLAGEGALRFARKLGYPEYDPLTPKAQKKLEWALRGLRGEIDDDEEFGWWRQADLPSLWNFDRSLSDSLGSTVGAVARGPDGAFAAAASTGGTLLMLRGRIGDTPLIGCGLYAGPAGAVTATGTGEEIVRRFMSKAVYDRIAAGDSAQAACEYGVRLFPEAIGVGAIAIDARSEGHATNREMPVGVSR